MDQVQIQTIEDEDEREHACMLIGVPIAINVQE
jgi:hypothetical protein